MKLLSQALLSVVYLAIVCFSIRANAQTGYLPVFQSIVPIPGRVLDDSPTPDGGFTVLATIDVGDSVILPGCNVHLPGYASYLAHYNNQSWQWALNNPIDQDGHAYRLPIDHFAVAPDGVTYIIGNALEPYGVGSYLLFGTDTLRRTGPSSLHYSYAYLAAIDSAGNWLWVRNVSQWDNVLPKAIAVYPGGGCVVAMDGPSAAYLANPNVVDSSDVYVSRFSDDGSFLWQNKAVSPGYDFPTEIAVSSVGTIAVGCVDYEGNGHFGSYETHSRYVVALVNASGSWTGALPVSATLMTIHPSPFGGFDLAGIEGFYQDSDFEWLVGNINIKPAMGNNPQGVWSVHMAEDQTIDHLVGAGGSSFFPIGTNGYWQSHFANIRLSDGTMILGFGAKRLATKDTSWGADDYSQGQTYHSSPLFLGFSTGGSSYLRAYPRTDAPVLRDIFYTNGDRALLFGYSGGNIDFGDVQFFSTHAIRSFATYFDLQKLDLSAPASPSLPQQFLSQVPNLVTLNGDKLNDAWQPKLNVPFSVRIYDRWGVQVWEEDTYSGSWPTNATTPGTYYYTLSPQGGARVKGYVEVIR